MTHFPTVGASLSSAPARPEGDTQLRVPPSSASASPRVLPYREDIEHDWSRGDCDLTEEGQ